MTQKKELYTTTIKRSVEQASTDRFVFPQQLIYFCWLLIFSLGACGEPEIKLDRAARRTIDTLLNHQLDSIRPILDSLCDVKKEAFIQHAVDSIVKERKKKEERLRLNIPQNEE